MDLGIPGLESAEPVGRGGFATVYKARQPAFARTVAVKVLSGTHFDEDSKLRFERELHALGLLSEHPGIVTVHDTGFTTDGRPYLTMAFVRQGTLADRIRTNGPMSWPEAVAVTVRLAGALETAHQSRIVHRDIKPANVLLSRYGAQLSDFGIARIAGAHETQSGLVTASVAYAAPEVLNGDRPTVAADIYSLGSTAYAMLLGISPFERPTDETFVAIMVRIQTQPPPDLREHGVPDDLAALLAQSLAKDPADRPRSALNFGRGLQDVMRAHGRQVPELILAPEVVADVGVSRERIDAPRAADVKTTPLAADTATQVNPRPVAAVPLASQVSDDRRRSRRRLAGVLVGGGVLAAVLTGVAFAGRDSGDGAGDTGGDATTTVTGPTTTESGVVVPPDTGSPTTTETANGTDAPTTTIEPVGSVPETDPPVDTTPATLASTTLPPISDEPVCGPGDGLLPSASEPVRVILDTGIGSGVDDLGALAVLHALADAGEAQILATMLAVGGDPNAGRTVDAINTYYGRPDIPIGVVTGPSPTVDPAPDTPGIAGFPNDLVDPPAAVDLYRQILAEQPDGSVTIVSGGFLTNLAALLASPPDGASDLTGEELVAAKVTRWVGIGGAYPDSDEILRGNPEFNFEMDTPATQSAVSGWPTPVVFSGFEVGDDVLTATTLQATTPPDNPVREGYRLHGDTEGAPSFDLTAVLVAVRGTAGGAFELCTGRNIVRDDGATVWEHRGGASQAYVRKVASDGEIAATLEALLTAPPAR